MKFFTYVSAVFLIAAGLLHAQQFDNPTTIPISYYGSSITSPAPGTFSFGAELGVTNSASGSGYGTPLYSGLSIGSVVPGKTYNVTMTTTGGLAYGMVHFQPVDGCEVYINGTKQNTYCNGKNYTFTLRVVIKSRFDGSGDSSLGLPDQRAGACTSFPEDRAFWYIGLGRMSNGLSAGAVGFRSGSITSDLFTPSALYYSAIDSSEVTVTRDGNGISRVQAPEVVLNVSTLSSTSYKIDACRPETSTTPFVTYTISLYAGGAGIRIDKLEDGVTTSSALQYADSTWTRYDWQKSTVFPSGNITTTAVNGLVSTVTYGSGAGSVVKQKNYIYMNGSYELNSTIVGPSVTSAPTTTYSYYTNAIGTAWPKALQWVIEPTGNWTKYDYFSGSPDSRAGQVKRVYKPWLDAPADPSLATTSNCYLETYDYAANFDGTLSVPSSKIITINGVTVGQTTWTYTWNSASVNAHTIAQIVQNDFVSASTSLATTTLAYRNDDAASFFRGKIHAVNRPDGTKDSYAYYSGTWNASSNTFTPGTGNDRLTLCFHGQASAGTGTSQISSWTVGSSAWTLEPLYLVGSLSTVSETVVDSHGRMVFAAENIYTGSGIDRITAHAYTFNNNNLLASDKDVIRSVSGADVSVGYTYNAGLLDTRTDVDGVQKTYGYDDYLRNTSITTSGSGDYPSKVQSFTYYGSGLKMTSQDCSCSPTPKTYHYEATGRIAYVTEPQPGSAGLLTTSTSYPTALQTTETDPLNATRTTTLYLDGKLKSKSGTGHVPMQTSYSVGSDGNLVATVQVGSSTANGWQEETRDWLGRPIKSRTPQFGWSTSASSKVTRRVNTYSLSTGQLASTDTFDEANGDAKLLPTHCYSYGNLGMLAQEGDDVDGSGGLTDASIDRIIKYSSSYSNTFGWVRQDVVTTLRTKNVPNVLNTLSDKRTRFTQFNGGSASGNACMISEVKSYDSSGRWYSDVAWVDSSAKTRTVKHTEQGVSNTASKVWTNGYLSNEQSLSGVAKTYKYNSAGLLSSVTEGTTNDAMYYTYYSGTKYLESVSRTTGTSTQATTSYTYSWDTSANTATVNATDASLNVTNAEYNALGLPWHIWGGGTQPTLYTYDAYGRRTGLTTWQAGSFSGSSWPSSPGAGNTVGWTLDPATGLISRKTYADNNYVDYTYNGRDQIKTRTNRGSWLTTYNYFDTASELTGELQSVVYTGGNYATPNLSFTYKRSGSLDTVNDASGSRVFDYNPDFKPSTETLDSTYYSGKVLSYSYESGTGRPTGYSFNGTSVLTQAGAYDPASGRMGTITGCYGNQSWAFSIGFNSGTDIVGTVTSGNYSRQVQLVSGFDAINSVTTSWNGATLGSFSAQYNDARGLQSSLMSGNSGAPVGSWSQILGLGEGTSATFSYDAQAQLNLAPTPSWVGTPGAQSLAARNGGWAYDLAGNRNSESGASSTSYTPGVNNQYTAITGANAESTLGYDTEGNMTADGTWSSYVYDHENRLVSMTNASATMTIAYDYLGRRIRKTVTGSGASDTKFVWAGWTLVGDLSASDGATPLRGYIWGPDFTDARGLAGGAGALLAQTSASGIAYAMPDQHGNIAGYLDANGNIVAAWEYSPFGKIVNSYGNVASYPIGYSSKYADPESGLVYYGMRYYSAKHGRFINRDPLEEDGGNNLYAMTQNRGVSGWDVLGLTTICYDEGGGVKICVTNDSDIPSGATLLGGCHNCSLGSSGNLTGTLWTNQYNSNGSITTNYTNYTGRGVSVYAGARTGRVDSGTTNFYDYDSGIMKELNEENWRNSNNGIGEYIFSQEVDHWRTMEEYQYAQANSFANRAAWDPAYRESGMRAEDMYGVQLARYSSKYVPSDFFVFGSTEKQYKKHVFSEVIGIVGAQGDAKRSTGYYAIVGGVGKEWTLPLGPLGKVGISYLPGLEGSSEGVHMDNIVTVHLTKFGFGGYGTNGTFGGFGYVDSFKGKASFGAGMGWNFKD